MPNYQEFDTASQLWTLMPIGAMSLAAITFLLLRNWRVMRTISDEEDEVTKMLNRSRREDLHNITNALRATLGHTRRLLSRVFAPMVVFALLGFIAMATIVLAVVGYRFNAKDRPMCNPNEAYTHWDSKWTVLLSGACVAGGFFASLASSFLYKIASPVIALDVAIQVAKDSSASGFAQSTAVMNWGSTWLGVLSASLFVAVGLSGSLMGDYGYGCAYAAALFTICGAVGAHAGAFVMSVIGNSFAEGMSISLYKVEADTQHRVDGTLRIASNTLQSASGLPITIGSTILDLQALYLLGVATKGGVGHLYVIPALAAASLCCAIILVLLAPAQHHRGLIRRARVGIIVATLACIGLGVAVLYSLQNGGDNVRPFGPAGSGHVRADNAEDEKNRFYYAFGMGALVQMVIVLSIEFTSHFSRVAGEHCDISTTAALNSISSFGSIYSFVALSIVAGTLNSIWWAWGPACCVIALAGGVLSLLPAALSHANARCIASSALCYSKASLMDPPEQELLEHLLYRCELLEAFSHNAVAYFPTSVLFCLCSSLTSVTFSTDGISVSPLICLCGLGLALLSDGLTRFYFSRTTWRLHRTVSAIVSTGDSRRPSSISGDSTDEFDDPLQGDRVIGVIAVSHLIVQVLMLFVIKYFVGNMGAVTALMYGSVVVIMNCARHTAEGALGGAVKNFVVQGGMAYAARYSTQHNNAVQAAASTTPLPMASNVMGFSIWRVSVAVFLIVSLAFEDVLMK